MLDVAFYSHAQWCKCSVRIGPVRAARPPKLPEAFAVVLKNERDVDGAVPAVEYVIKDRLGQDVPQLSPAARVAQVHIVPAHLLEAPGLPAQRQQALSLRGVAWPRQDDGQASVAVVQGEALRRQADELGQQAPPHVPLPVQEQEQAALARFRPPVDVGAVRQQRVHRLLLAASAGLLQRRPVGPVHHLGIGPVLHELRDAAQAGLRRLVVLYGRCHCGQVQGGVPGPSYYLD